VKFKFLNGFVLFFIVVSMTSCTTFEGRYQRDTKLLIEYALYDFPFPPTSRILEKETVILGSGERWSGKVRFLDAKTPAQLLKFYAEVVTASGWNMETSTVSAGIFLVFTKEGRVATVEINRLSFLQGQNLLSTRRTSVTVSVNNVGSVGSSTYKTPKPSSNRPNTR